MQLFSFYILINIYVKKTNANSFAGTSYNLIRLTAWCKGNLIAVVLIKAVAAKLLTPLFSSY